MCNICTFARLDKGISNWNQYCILLQLDVVTQPWVRATLSPDGVRDERKMPATDKCGKGNANTNQQPKVTATVAGNTTAGTRYRDYHPSKCRWAQWVCVEECVEATILIYMCSWTRVCVTGSTTTTTTMISSSSFFSFNWIKPISNWLIYRIEYCVCVCVPSMCIV